MEVNRNGKQVFDLRLTCIKYLLFLLNAVFIIISVVTISGGISTMVAFTSYYSLMFDGLQMLSIFWIVVGAIFMTVALFGMFAAFKESTMLANLYGIAMMLVFILQIGAAIAAFTLISNSRYMVSNQLGSMMRGYGFSHYGYRIEVDFIQTKFECCGIEGPSDWQNYDAYATPRPTYAPYTDSWYYYRSTTADDYYYPKTDNYLDATTADAYYDPTSEGDYYSRTTDDYRYPSRTPTTTYPTTTTKAPRTDLMPASCCVRNSNYVNLSCEKYHMSGCFDPVHQIVSESIMMTGSSALVVSVIQILGVLFGFTYARCIRHRKIQRNVQIWNSGQEYSPVEQPMGGDYSPISN